MNSASWWKDPSSHMVKDANRERGKESKPFSQSGTEEWTNRKRSSYIITRGKCYSEGRENVL